MTEAPILQTALADLRQQAQRERFIRDTYKSFNTFISKKYERKLERTEYLILLLQVHATRSAKPTVSQRLAAIFEATFNFFRGWDCNGNI